MEPDTLEAQETYQHKLKETCEALGLVVTGSVVAAPLAKPLAVDASCLDLSKPVPSLMYLAYLAGRRDADQDLREELMKVLLSPDLEHAE